jgi:hypothetical protein
VPRAFRIDVGVFSHEDRDDMDDSILTATGKATWHASTARMVLAPQDAAMLLASQR